ncbi:hypothetical protein [Streptomyces violascens]|uniref:Uncharacterized protein n=1 Tax=Streptomyces violascens TaxID=67381 RepID=A0ABQ3QRZ0_9ACTN|nr:hypothetical protein [Streptomyces violascens]GHI40051.1 hypothetical protein Sviol_44590 [Streptomyces violascens]
MSEAVDADELLRRIRHARDWALSEEEARFAEYEASPDSAEGVSAHEVFRTFNIVRTVLDEIVEPGKHAAKE